MAAVRDSTRTTVEAAPQGAPEREPNLFHFGLRQLFYFFSAATLLCAALATLGGAWPIVAGSLAALAAAHVFGTFLGTRLRDTSREVQQWKARPGSEDSDAPVALPQPVRIIDLQLPATTPLAAHGRIAPWCNACMIIGMTLSAAAGGGIYWTFGDRLTWPGLSLAAASCGVIGGWASLLGANFWAIARHAVRQANLEVSSDEPRP